jgi:hypothetical protein
MKCAISLRRSEHRGGLLMAVFEFGFNKVSIVRSDLAFERLSKGQGLIDLRPVSAICGPLGLQLLKAVLNAL